MSAITSSAAALRVIGDSLVPEEVTQLLGTQPSKTRTKGEQWTESKGGRVHTAKSGSWCLDASGCEPANLDRQVEEILGKLTGDLNVWSGIGQRFRMDLFVGLFMEEGDKGLSLAPQTLAALGLRGVELVLCIYGPGRPD